MAGRACVCLLCRGQGQEAGRTKVFSVWSLLATPAPTIRQSAIVWQLSMINQFARDGQDRPRLRPAMAGLASALATAYSRGITAPTPQC